MPSALLLATSPSGVHTITLTARGIGGRITTETIHLSVSTSPVDLPPTANIYEADWNPYPQGYGDGPNGPGQPYVILTLRGDHGNVPGVRVLAEHPKRVMPDGRKLPVIMMQYVGAGKVLFHATDETWRWRRRMGDVFLARYWVQALRSLSRAKLADGEHSGFLRGQLRVVDPNVVDGTFEGISADSIKISDLEVHARWVRLPVRCDSG